MSAPRRCRVGATWLALAALGACAGVDEDRGFGGDATTGQPGGVRLRRGAQPVTGSGAFCTRPATVLFDQLCDETPEGREIAREGLRPGSARYELLRGRMHRRLVRVCASVARALGHDLVARDGDIEDARGLAVIDVTSDVLAALRDDA